MYEFMKRCTKEETIETLVEPVQAVPIEKEIIPLYIPPGFAHGFCVLSDTALVAYKCTERYCPEAEITVAWNDPDIGVRWPITGPTLSEKDKAGQTLKALRDRLPRY